MAVGDGGGDAIAAAAGLAKAFSEWEAAGGDSQDQKVARVRPIPQPGVFTHRS